MSGLPSSPSLTSIEAEIQRLHKAREALQAQQARLRVEELKTLADAYARKLQAAGFSIAEGLAALKPYARVRLQDDAATSPATTAPSAPAPRAARTPRVRPTVDQGIDRLHQRATEVLGDDGRHWLRRAHPLLGGQAPLEVASTPQGVDRVHALLAAYARGA